MTITVRRPVHHFSPSRGRRWRLRFTLFVLLLASVIIQTVGGVGGIFFSFRPELVLIVVVCWSLREGPSGGWFAGMVGGFLADIFSSGMLGMNTLSLAVVGLLVSVSSRPLYQAHLSTRVVMVGISSAVYGLLYYLLLLIFASPPSWGYALRVALWPTIWQTTLISPLWLWLTERTLKTVEGN